MEPPPTNRVFESRQAAQEYCQDWARAHHYALVVRTTGRRKLNGIRNGPVNTVRLNCDKGGGGPRPEGPRLRKRTSTKTKCPFQLKINEDGGLWTIALGSSIEHNHEPSVGPQEHAILRRQERATNSSILAAFDVPLWVTYVPADCGSIIPGKAKAPDAFRSVGLARRLQEAGFTSVRERLALEAPARYTVTSLSPGSVRNEPLNIEVCQRVRETVANNLGNHSYPAFEFQLIIGGECCMLPAILAAFWQHADSSSPPLRVGLVYIDADTDLASPTDPASTGFFAGMNTTHLIRSSGALKSMEQFSRPSGEPVCDSTNTVFFGTNMSSAGNKSEHLTYLFDNNYKVVSSNSVAREPEERAREALVYLEKNVDIIMVHWDIDSIDPQMFPLANVPNFTDVTFDTMVRALQVFMKSEKVRGLTLAEVNPDHDPGLHMVKRVADEIVELLAAKIRK